MDKNLLIIRFMLTLTVAENTIISKKPLSKILKSNTRSEMGEDEVVAEVEEAEEDEDGAIAENEDEESGADEAGEEF